MAGYCGTERLALDNPTDANEQDGDGKQGEWKANDRQANRSRSELWPRHRLILLCLRQASMASCD